MAIQAAIGDITSWKHLRNFRIMWVCQRGQLEMESVLLAASLRKFLRNPAELVLGIPQWQDGSLDPTTTTLDFLKGLDVDIVQFRNPVAEEHDFEQPYPHSNKLFLFELESNADKTIFFDSDTIFLEDCLGHPAFQVPLTLIPVGFPGAHIDGFSWEPLYQACDIEMPCERMITIGKTASQAPLPWCSPNAFTANVIGVSGEHRLGFFAVWHDVYRKLLETRVLHTAEGTPLKHVDQIALSLAVTRLKIPYICQWGGDRMRFHYWNPQRLVARPKIMEIVRSIITDFPGISSVYQELRAQERIEPWPEELESCLVK